MSIAKRLLDARIKAGMSQADLAEKVGVSQQSIQKIEAGQTNSPRRIADIAKAVNVSAQWLQFGTHDGNGLKTEFEVKEWEEIPSHGNVEFVDIPVLDIELAAGSGSSAELIELEEYTYPFRRDELRKYGVSASNARIVKIVGNSLYPVLNGGDLVAVDITKRDIKDGDLYAIRDGVLLRVKILIYRPDGGLIIRSFNRDEYPDEQLPRSEAVTRVHVIGRVFWSSRSW
ncbi:MULTISPECIES: XRE family transcriptional regulator [Providencia]|uniref:XRE family transcriptional regulator n=1 Tax=Providencia TaxID=586 RepID=UPI000D936612|nr:MULTISPECIES: S24 family peptidase [Providencia]UBX48851.1 helix-turn-helix domain-containing protein [Providencia alcalifaciens]WBM59298.1 helix-turn-helix domain-containing protein [Providencia sp. PROV188]CAG9417851.1 HTH-type transcriptional regulator PrtR [Providencia alcalifaciens]CAG9419119.1 HTH-type transcriptional regulator PrtR [Providencia alcalifaciens]CAG9423172.1 HTH-type transcriptional regulator PrtR [Providencia alcalifaciens]